MALGLPTTVEKFGCEKGVFARVTFDDGWEQGSRASRHPADTDTACRNAMSGVRHSTAGRTGF